MNAPVNYTTQIAATKTVGKMQAMLAEHGARRIAVDYQDGGPCALAFMLDTKFGPKYFTLPVNVSAMQSLLVEKERKRELKAGAKATRTSHEQAERVAWRVMKDWLAAQLALIESRMATIDEVMLPYLQVSEQHTLYQRYRHQETLALNGGSNA